MLYYRIGDKRELYRRVVLRGQKSFKKAIAGAISRSKDAPETVNAVLAGIAANAAQHRDVPSIILREIAGSGETMPDDGKKGIKDLMSIIRTIVTMGIEEGSFRKVDPTVLHFLLIGAVFSLSLTGELRSEISPEVPGPVTPEEVARTLSSIILKGIMKRGN